MKNTFHLKVQATEVFDYFIAVLLQDVLAYTGRTVTRTQLKAGFTYQKNISNNPKKPRIASVRLTEYDYPLHYAVVYTDPADKEKQPSLMMRLRMMATVRQIRRAAKRPVLV